MTLSRISSFLSVAKIGSSNCTKISSSSVESSSSSFLYSATRAFRFLNGQLPSVVFESAKNVIGPIKFTLPFTPAAFASSYSLMIFDASSLKVVSALSSGTM